MLGPATNPDHNTAENTLTYIFAWLGHPALMFWRRSGLAFFIFSEPADALEQMR